MFGITAAAELVTMGAMGYLSSKIGEKATISLGALVGAVYFGIMSFSQSLPLLYAAHVMYAIFIAALLGVAMAYVQGLVANPDAEMPERLVQRIQRNTGDAAVVLLVGQRKVVDTGAYRPLVVEREAPIDAENRQRGKHPGWVLL